MTEQDEQQWAESTMRRKARQGVCAWASCYQEVRDHREEGPLGVAAACNDDHFEEAEKDVTLY